jgi:hypothetical protein
MKIMSNGFTLIRNAGLFLLLFTLVSCDPAQTIQIVNESHDAATVTVVFKKGLHDYKFVEPTASDTLIIALEPTGQNAVWNFQFGLGTWKIQSSIDSLIGAMDRIEIVSSKSTEIYQGEQQIRTFLEDRITGNRKELIEIKLK